MAKARYDERTLKMMKDFMSLHEQGLTIAEIAEECRISVWTIYDHLGEIAEKNHTTRDSLLQVIHSTGWSGHAGKDDFVKIDVDAFQKKVDAAVKDIDEMIDDIKRTTVEEEV